MKTLELSPIKPAVIIGWRIATFDDGKYKNHPRKFQVKQAAEEFAILLRKTGKHEKVEVRDIMKVDGV
jgi:hypothetical protein